MKARTPGWIWLFAIAISMAEGQAWAQTLAGCGGGCPSQALSCGESLNGELAGGDCLEDGRPIDVFSWLPASPSDTEILVRAEGFEPRLLVFAVTEVVPCFLRIEGSDACAPGDAGAACVRYDAFPFQQIVFVTSAGKATTGKYTIETSCGSLRCESACRAGAIPCGGTVQGDLGGGVRCALRGGGSFETWDLAIPEFASVTVTASPAAPFLASLHYDDSSGSRSCLELVGPSACDGGPCIQAAIINSSPGASFHLAVASPPPGGPYDLSVACEPFDPCASCPATAMIACGEKKQGQLGPDDCEVLFPSQDGTFRTRTERWTFDVAEAGLFKVWARAPGGSVYISVIKPEDCSQAQEGVPEQCPEAPWESCNLFTLEPGQYRIEVVQSAKANDPPLDYDLEVTCIDLGPCEDCVRGTIACGETVSGELGNGDCKEQSGAFLDVLALAIEPGPPRDIVITARSAAFSPRIVLFDRVCGEIGSSDACAGAPAGSACLTTPSGFRRKLFIGVTATEAAAAGSYDLEVSCAPSSPCASRCLRGGLKPGDTVAGEVGPGDCTQDGSSFHETWTLDVEEAGLIDISLQTEHPGGGFDVRGQDCSQVIAFSEGPPDRQRAIVRLDPGSYSVVVRAGSPGQPGNYTLRVEARDCGACTPVGALSCEENGVIAGTLEPGDCPDPDGFLHDVFTFETPVLRQVVLSSTQDFGWWLWILREDCAPVLTFANGSSDSLGLVLEAGKYTFVVTAFGPQVGGDYAIPFSCKTTPLCVEECVDGSLECGKPATGAVTESDCLLFASRFDTWRFDVPADGVTEISVRDVSAAGFLSFAFLRSDCEEFPDFDDLCVFPRNEPARCHLEEGEHTLFIEAPASIVHQSGEQPYEVMVTTSACQESRRRLPGDCDGNGKLDVSDAICLLGFLFRREPAPLECGEAPGDLGAEGLRLLDWDSSETLSVVDALQGLLHLFGGGPPHALGAECIDVSACSNACDG